MTCISFSIKQKAKILLENQFIKDSDYKLLLNPQVKQSVQTKWGDNKETIMLIIRIFKIYCLIIIRIIINKGTKINVISGYIIAIQIIIK